MTFGVKFILFLHLLLALVITAGTSAFLIGGWTGWSGDYLNEALLLCYGLACFPLIILAFVGVIYKNEASVNLYLWFLRASLLVASILVIKTCLVAVINGSACDAMESFFNGMGSAWVCGIVRWSNIALFIAMLGVFGYFQHVVESHCEDLGSNSGGPDLTDLLGNTVMAKGWSVYDSVEGLQKAHEYGLVGSSNSNLYAAKVRGVGGGNGIDMNGYTTTLEFPTNIG
eukprot:CAMPEP_0169113582 /NCGR_PEP_ID=MMETSP1015-20121227/28286_1 /TAXON_ID=342587 /ORGANISM="Karlodinium micrum, Strain CCMP2283" /LENGTH=227 /DNA_ID=CAMNT_0009175777 /DNA_START=132 /DNA_END=815 /DNA_ORIENTATION=-